MDYGGGDYSTTSYGASGGNNGGGFMPGGSQESPNAKKRYGNNTLRPVTIRQLAQAELPDADGDAFTLDGAECTQVTIVGLVTNISTQTTNTTYKLDDGTGVCEVKMWSDPDSNNSNGDDGMDGGANGEAGSGASRQVREGTYVRAWGRLKSFGRRHVVAHIVRPVEGINEVNYHLLEATAVHLALTRGPPGGAGKSGAGADGKGAGTGAAAGAGGDRLGAGASVAARKVFACIRDTPQGNEGLHMQDIALRTGLEVSEVLKAGDELQSKGVIYTTVDDHTWALLDI